MSRDSGQNLLTLDGLQEQVDEWIGQFEEGYWPPLDNLARLAEEVGELAREVNDRFGSKPKKANEEPGTLEEELGDILFVLACMANSWNMSLEAAFRQTMNKYQKRDSDRWTRKSRGGEAGVAQDPC